MNIKVLTLAAVAAGVAIVTFVALNLAAPITHATEEHAEGVTAEQVFAASIAEPGASAPRGAEPSAAQADIAAPAASSTLPSAPPPTEVAMVADAPAAAPATAAPAPKSGSCSSATVDPAARPAVVTAAGSGPADAPAETSTAAAPKVADAPKPEAAPKIPEAAPKIADAPSRKKAPAPAPAPRPGSKPPMPKSAPAEARTAWWPAKAPGKLNLVYAGEASFTKAIVLLFDGAFDNGDSANQHVKVTTRGGETVKGKWLVANGNRQMLLFNVGPGLYRLDVGGGMTDKDGRAISAASGGLVFVP